MTEEQKALLARHGWELECESPREARHTETGSFATLWALDAVLDSLEAEEMTDTESAYDISTEELSRVLKDVGERCSELNPLALMVMPFVFITSKNQMQEFLDFVTVFSNAKKKETASASTVQDG